jgi:hypothetical protein
VEVRQCDGLPSEGDLGPVGEAQNDAAAPDHHNPSQERNMGGTPAPHPNDVEETAGGPVGDSAAEADLRQSACVAISENGFVGADKLEVMLPLVD